jgi:hypothetical protein
MMFGEVFSTRIEEDFTDLRGFLSILTQNCKMKSINDSLKTLSFLVFWLFGQALFAQNHFTKSTDKPSTHGMLVFGGVADSPLYASHLPMFHSPHDYQVLLHISVNDSTRALYAASRKKFPNERVYTIEPEVFVLPDMIQQPRPFKVHLYRGHFERGGTKIAENVLVEIRTVLHFRKFDPAMTRPTRAEFLLFGTSKESFLAHFIAAKPDFDQILSVRSDAQLGSVIQSGIQAITITNSSNKPLRDGQRLTTRFNATTATPQQTLLRVHQNLYCEFGDLK